MSIEDEFTRDTRAMERIASALEGWLKLEREKFDKQFPAPKVKRDAEIIRADERREQYNDKPTDEWIAETESAAGPSRFAKRLEESGTAAATATGRIAPPFPERDGNQTKPS
jgi:hypothetical protein